MPYYLAMKLIDPTTSRGNPFPTTWNAVKDICKNHDLNHTEVKAKILEMRYDFVDLNQFNVAL